MIVAGGLDWSRLLREAGAILAVLFAYDVGVSVLFVVGGVTWVSIPELPLPLLGSVLGVLMGLRNNLAYGRWWEARTLWGAANNASRGVVRTLIALLPDPSRVSEMAHVQIAWAQALRCAMRGQDPWPAIDGLLTPAARARVQGAANLPTALLAEQARHVAAALAAGTIDTIRAAEISRALGEATIAQGGIERIKRTPLPTFFSQFPRAFVVAYCLLLPLGLVSDLRLLTPVGSTIVGLAFVALDRTGRHLESPFENTVHDVPMTAITRGIEIDLRQMAGEAEVPAALQPVEGVLW